LQIETVDRMNSERAIPGLEQPSRSISSPLERFASWLPEHWLAFFVLIWGAWVTLPFLAAVFMQIGWELPARWIYAFYSFQCHQLPQRSFFLFGSQLTYSLDQIQAASQHAINPMDLRHFVGSPSLGWKVAWSDRMVSMYTSVVFFALLWGLVRRRVGALPIWGLALFLLPMLVDGGTHLVSDLGGIGQGFRYTNAWLAALTNYAFPPGFYLGDAWGSFNSILRLVTGLLFGLGVVWYTLPHLERIFASTRPTGRPTA